MRRFLYDDFYEGFLHILVMLPPVITAIISNQINGSSSAIGISLLVSIFGGIYSTRNLYKNKEYSKNKRVKLCAVINLFLLAISLIYTFAVMSWHINTGLSYYPLFKDFTVPVFTYCMTIVSYFIEMILVLKDDFSSFHSGSKNIKSFAFNVTPGAKN